MNHQVIKTVCIAALTAGTLSLLSGCSLLNSNSNKYVVTGSGQELSKKSDTKPLAPPKAQASATSGNKTAKKSTATKNKNAKSKKTSAKVTSVEIEEARREVAELDAQAPPAKAPATTPSTTTAAVPSGFTLNGEWTIYSVRNNLITGEERPYITFDLPAKRFYGSNGCNIINGDVVSSDPGKLKLDNIISTMKMCADAPFEYLINLALSEVQSYAARQEGPNTFLDLKGNGNTTVLVLRRHNMDFLNGAWAVTSLNGTAMPVEGSEDAATMTIDIPDLKIHGTTGCNIFNGELFIDPDKNNSMQFLNIGTTRMACPPGSRETEFLLGLEMVETAKAIGPDTIAMYSTDGTLIFEMRRINYNLEK